MDFPIHIALNLQGGLQLGEHLVPDARLAPALKAAVDRGPLPVSFGHIAPGRARSQNPKHAIQELPMFLRRSSTLRSPLGEQRFYSLPLFIG